MVNAELDLAGLDTLAIEICCLLVTSLAHIRQDEVPATEDTLKQGMKKGNGRLGTVLSRAAEGA